MSKKITDKIKELLTAEDLKVFEEAVEKMIASKVALKEDELKTKYDEIAEEYVSKKVAEGIEAAKATLIEEYDEKLKAIEEKVATKLSSFLDNVIVEQISESTIEKIAINEVAMPIVEQIRKVFGSNYVNLDTDGTNILKAEQKKVQQLESALSDANTKLMEKDERLQKATVFLLISEKTEGLTNSQKQRVANMFKNKEYDEVKENIDEFVEMIKESTVVKTTTTDDKGLIDDVITEGDVIKESTTVVTEDKEEYSFVEKANKYLND